VIFAALAVGLLTLYSMVKIWNEAFWKDAPAGDRQPDRAVPPMMIAPAVMLALGTVLIGVFPEPCIAFALRTADQLIHPSAYIEAVLQTRNPVNAEP
jgi:multicomponent Na+:H+ antiporter subunit D